MTFFFPSDTDKTQTHYLKLERDLKDSSKEAAVSADKVTEISAGSVSLAPLTHINNGSATCDPQQLPPMQSCRGPMSQRVSTGGG